MPHPRLEIVTYQVASVHDADDRRRRAMALISEFNGFSGWLPLANAANGTNRADIVVWADQATADAAAAKVGTADDFAPFRATISTLGTMGHFALPAGGLPMMQTDEGMELGRFRPRPDVNEDMLRAAHSRMIERHLSHQPGWRGQRLAKLEDGTWLDLAFAATPDHARAICASWTGNPDCDAFLELIEPIGMDFAKIS